MKIVIKKSWHKTATEEHPSIESFTEFQLANVDSEGGQLEYLQNRLQETATLLSYVVDRCVEAKLFTPEELLKRFSYDLVSKEEGPLDD